jgi:hypothetical protein
MTTPRVQTVISVTLAINRYLLKAMLVNQTDSLNLKLDKVT